MSKPTFQKHQFKLVMLISANGTTTNTNLSPSSGHKCNVSKTGLVSLLKKQQPPQQFKEQLLQQQQITTQTV